MWKEFVVDGDMNFNAFEYSNGFVAVNPLVRLGRMIRRNLYDIVFNTEANKFIYSFNFPNPVIFKLSGKHALCKNYKASFLLMLIAFLKHLLQDIWSS